MIVCACRRVLLLNTYDYVSSLLFGVVFLDFALFVMCDIVVVVCHFFDAVSLCLYIFFFNLLT